MPAVSVRPISLPRQAGRFVRAWWPIYRADPHWVPPLIAERRTFLDPRRNPYFRVADVQCFLATRGRGAARRSVGTIAATVDHELQKREPGVGLFGFFEFHDDPEVVQALWDAAAAWLRHRGMTVARGPYSFNQNHEFGLLVKGFGSAPVVALPHARHYYPARYESLGLRGVMDWYAYWFEPGPLPPVVDKLAARVQRRNPTLRVETMDPGDYDRGVALFLEIFNDAWEHNWGHIPLTAEEFAFTAERLRQILDPGLCLFAFLGDECVAASIALPDSNQITRRMNGRVWPLGWVHALGAARRIDVMRLFVLGVKHRYQHLGLGAPLYVRTWEIGLERGYRGADASQILATNHRMRGAVEKLGARIYKTYRAYEKRLD